MNSQTPHDVVIPAASLEEAWLLRGASAFDEAAQLVKELLVGSTVPQHLVNDLHRLNDLVEEQLRKKAQLNWEDYYRLTGVPTNKRTPISAAIEFDQNKKCPQVRYNDPPGDSNDAFGVVDIPMGEDDSFALPSAFKQVRLAALPKGTRIITIRDARYVALATIVEVIQVIQRDIAAAMRGCEPSMAWRRINTMGAVYQRAATEGKKDAMEDEYQNWAPNFPDSIDLSTAARRICEIASSARAMRVLAVHSGACWLRHHVDNLSTLPEEDRLKALTEALDNVYGDLDVQLNAMHRLHLTSAKHPIEDYTPVMIFRPIPETAPVLAAVPISASKEVKPLKSNSPLISAKEAI